MTRLAFVVSHPIQYYAPLHKSLASRSELSVKVFFTWHDGRKAVQDRGFLQPVSWDVPLTDGYEFELAPNVASDQGTHHFLGLRNPSLVDRLLAWKPDVVHVTGWAWESHLRALWALRRARIPVLFRGDSHLLDERVRGPRWMLKRSVLTCVFRWPSAFLYVGKANRAYYEAFGVQDRSLIHCPHSVEVSRFAMPNDAHEAAALTWRRDLRIGSHQPTVLFAGKFEARKRPLNLMYAVLQSGIDDLVLILVGSGEQEAEVKALASAHPSRFRVLPFQNQAVMPVVYRLGDLFVLPSAWGETWGLAVNEALACGRPAIVSDKVGCGPDVFEDRAGHEKEYGGVFLAEREGSLVDALRGWSSRVRSTAARHAAAARARDFDIETTERTLLEGVRSVLA